MLSNISMIYTPLSEVEKIIYDRIDDRSLHRKVNEFYNNDIPDVMCGKPRAVIARNIATPNNELHWFLKKTSMFSALCLEYYDDTFYSGNIDKLSLLRTPLNMGQKILEKVNIVHSLEKQNGMAFTKIKTASGKQIISFHHELLKLDNQEIDFNDASDWVKRKGRSAKQFYPFFLGLFVRNGILFDNYLTKTPSDQKFMCEIVIPSFDAVSQIFGVKPLIVRLLPSSSETSIYWNAYEKETFGHAIMKESKYKIKNV